MTISLKRPFGYPIIMLHVKRWHQPYAWFNRVFAQARRGWEILITDTDYFAKE